MDLQALKHGLTHLFFPHLCEGCNRPLVATEKVLCLGCSLEIPETNYHHIADNETALRFAGRIPFARATSLAYFTNEGLLQHLLHGLKYRNKKEIGYYLGRRLAKNLQSEGWAASMDLIIPVPLHQTKKAKRGYNQSLLIAQGMSEILNMPTREGLLLRVRDTESQTHKTRIERVNNMTEAFKIKENAGLEGRHILLVDDVLTTGATIEACALALMEAENVKISVATIGIAIS